MSVTPDALLYGVAGFGAASMFMGFSPGAYGPDLVKLMTDALDGAWARIESAPADTELSRLVLAGAIIDQVDAGVREHGRLVAKALEALAAAVRVSGEKLSLKQAAPDSAGSDSAGRGG